MIRKLIGILVLASPVLAFGQFETEVAAGLQPTHVVTPRVPSEFRGKEAEVNVILKLNRDGTVGAVEVQDATDTEHATSVINAVREWRFEPAGEEAAERKVLLPVRFVASNN